WPNLFLGPIRRRSVVIVLVGRERLAAPVALLYLLDLFFAEPEVVADFVDERFSDDGADFVLVVAVFFDWFLQEGHAVRKRVAVTPGALCEGSALIQAVQGVGRLDFHLIEQLRTRFVFDDQRQVLHLAAEAPGNERDRFNDESLELFA